MDLLENKSLILKKCNIKLESQPLLFNSLDY